jgi:hypothetical protein
MVRWTAYQKRLATIDEVRAWWRRWPTGNIGIVTGAVSGVVVLDVDGRTGEESLKSGQYVLPPTVVSRTGNGLHFFFKHPRKLVPTRAGILPGLDVRGDGGYVVVPPSVHASGRRYSWGEHSGPGDAEYSDVPGWLSALFRSTSLAPDAAGETFLRGAAEGERNVAAARLAGRFLSRGFSATETLDLLVLWNERNRPPLGREELVRVVKSIAGREARRILA